MSSVTYSRLSPVATVKRRGKEEFGSSYGEIFVQTEHSLRGRRSGSSHRTGRFDAEGRASGHDGRGRKEIEAQLKKGSFDLVILGPTLTRNDRHHLPYMVKKAHEGLRVLVLHADGGRHPYVDAATDTGRSIESILETISSMMASQATVTAR